MEKNDSVQRIGMLRERNALLNDRLRMEKEVSEINQRLAELEAAIFLEDQGSQEKESGQTRAAQ